jgi:hypothetical protein
MKKYLGLTLGIVSLFGFHLTCIAAVKSTAVRSVSGDRLLKVVIRVKPDSSVNAYAIEERAPKDCQISHVDNKGSFFKPSNIIKWGVFFDPIPRTLSYKLSCSNKESASREFMGLASFDGQSIEISGDKSLK